MSLSEGPGLFDMSIQDHNTDGFLVSIKYAPPVEKSNRLKN